MLFSARAHGEDPIFFCSILVLCGRKLFVGGAVAGAAQLQLCTPPNKIQPREADSATSNLSISSPFFLLHFRNRLLSFARISDTGQTNLSL